MKNQLNAVSPIDGRYAGKTNELSDYFSEKALFKYRVQVEVEYFITLCDLNLKGLPAMPNGAEEKLRNLYSNFTDTDAAAIKEIEKTTNHDVKAVEYFIKNKLDELGIETNQEFIHFGLTSQDINNTAVPLSMLEATRDFLLPELNKTTETLASLAKDWSQISLLARTHGQPASPTILGKEIQVFVSRLQHQVNHLHQLSYPAKFGGATGNLNAHNVAYPDRDWHQFANGFVTSLGLSRSYPTTQIEHYDGLAEIFDNWKRINTILIDLARDIWTYISMDYFKQKIVAGEVGSSAMPHKVNPIDFENAEGNLGIANAIFEHLSAKLPISRLQRDLTDSTVLRNVGVPYAHTLISLKSLQKGLSKLILSKDKIAADLDDHWEVCAEAIQTILRREGYPKPYEALKELTRRNEKITAESLAQFIDTLAVDDGVKAELKAITPHNYIGRS